MANPAWVKGVSGNPRGRPRKGKTLTDILEKELRKRNVQTPEGSIPAKEAIARKLIAMAIAGDVAALKCIYDRIDGKPLQALTHSGSITASQTIVYLPDNGRGDGPKPEAPDA